MIKITNLSKTYKGSNVKAVENVSLEVKGGEIYGFLGPNGAGKSTTIKCLTGILPFTEGSIEVCGINLTENPVLAKSKIGFVPDSHYLYDGLTGLQYINFICDVFDVPTEVRKEKIASLSKMFALEEKLDNQISTYSHGMKQKISVISALVHDPDVWVLDEPMTGLDPQSAYNLKLLMAEHVKKGKVVFFSSHVLDVVEKICTKVAIINNGKIITVCDMQELKNKRSDLSLEELFLNLTRIESVEEKI